LIDSLLVGFIGFVLALILGFLALFARGYNEAAAGFLESVTILSVLMGSIVYHVGMRTSDGQTIGKSTLRLISDAHKKGWI